MTKSCGNSRLSAFVLALVAYPIVLMAQSNTTSALTGVVRDPQGKFIAGVMVRISSNVLIGGERTTRTSENGSYRIGALPPGTYRIVIEATGLNTLTGNESLTLGQTSTVNFKFAAAASATVEVVADQVQASGVETAAATTLSAATLDVLPLGRDVAKEVLPRDAHIAPAIMRVEAEPETE